MIQLRQVYFDYPEKKVLRGIDLKIGQGEFVGITGPTGSGKTTLAYCLNGLIPHAIKGKFRGTVRVDGLETAGSQLSRITRKVGLVFQDPDWQLFNLSVEEEVMFGLKNLKIKAANTRTRQALKQLGLLVEAKTDPQKLSQGQKQQLCIASVVAMRPKIIVLDEPVSQLDYRNSLNIYRVLKQLNQAGTTIIVIEHNTEMLAMFATKIALMDQGQIVSFGPKATILKQGQLLNRLGIKPVAAP